MYRDSDNHPHVPFILLVVLSLVLSLSLLSCSDLFEPETADDSDIYHSELESTPDWTDATHGKLTDAEITENLDMVFDTSIVQKLRIVIEPDNWELMNENLEDLKDELGKSNDFSSVDNPFFVPCEVFYSPDGTEEQELEWYKVGIRFKGNSSLYSADCSKLPFKLDFDEFEDTYESIDNQRFYGFKQLNLKSNYKDESEMHEVVTADLFRAFGLTTAHCSFYELYLNVDGSDESDDIYYGLYTLVEEIDDTVIDTQYVDDSGNLYKPEDDAASFASGTYDEDEYGLKTDDDETYSDILALYEAINSTDADSWETDLEAIFDVDVFLKWLAANTVLQNFDSYGVMPHNYFLYHDPETDTFQWIPWDHNEALESHPQCLDLDMDEVDEDWPLIRYVLDNEGYTATYTSYVNEFAATLFNEEYLDPVYAAYEELIEEYVSAESADYTFTSYREFSTAVDELMDHTSARYAAAMTYAPTIELHIILK